MYDPFSEIVITQGDGDNMLNALLALTDPGDEVILTDPTYAGMIQRVRLVGAVPRQVPLRGDSSGWRLDLDALAHAGLRPHPGALLDEPVISLRLGGERWGVDVGRHICRERGIILLYNMPMEAIVFGGRPVVVPSGLEGMRDLTVTSAQSRSSNG